MDPKVNRQLMMDEPRCCCGIRIRTGAIAAVIIGAIYSAIMAIIIIILDFMIVNKINVVEHIQCVLMCEALFISMLNFISYLLFIGVVYVTKKDKSWAYLPYLIIQGIEFILIVIVVIYYILVATGAVKIYIWNGNYETISKAGLTSWVIILIAFLLFTFVLEAYLYSVIWRAYMFTKNFVEPNRFGQVQRVGVATGNTVTLDIPKKVVIP